MRQFARRYRQRGVVVIFTAVLIAVLLGFAALAIDLGRMFVLKTEVQSAMDACALAASTQLRPGLNDSGALTRAVDYGLATVDVTKASAGGGARPMYSANRANFQKDAIARADVEVAFADFIDGPYQTIAGGANFNTAKYVRCSYPYTNLPVFFARFVGGPLSATIPASAVSTLAPSQTVCAFPVGACKVPGTTKTTTPHPFGLVPGQWLTTVTSPGAAYGTGNFGWLDFTPPSGGASELSSIIRGEGVCDLRTGIPVGQTGVISSLVDAWNSRFGIYTPGPINSTNTQPDRTGYAYTSTNWPAQSGAHSDYEAKRTAATPYQGNALSGINLPNNASWLTQSQHNTLGRLRRLVIVPVIDCEVWNTNPSGNPLIEDLACILLLHPVVNPGGGGIQAKIEYLGLASAPNSPCATSGLGGGTAGPLAPVLVQ